MITKSKRGQTTERGFTIVELLIVIVVIGILAAITIVAYTGMQQRAHDTQRRSDLSAMAKVLNLYAIDHRGDLLGTTSGCGKNGSGYWMGVYDGNPSLKDCLVDAGYSEMARVADPSGCDTPGTCGENFAPRYMKVNCTKNATPAVYWLAFLESTPQNPTLMESICDDAASVSGFGSVETWDERYGMNYAVRVQ